MRCLLERQALLLLSLKIEGLRVYLPPVGVLVREVAVVDEAEAVGEAERVSNYEQERRNEVGAHVHGVVIPQQDVVQMALAAWLEDAEDLELIEERRKSGKFHSLEDAKRLLEL